MKHISTSCLSTLRPSFMDLLATCTLTRKVRRNFLGTLVKFFFFRHYLTFNEAKNVGLPKPYNSAPATQGRDLWLVGNALPCSII